MSEPIRQEDNAAGDPLIRITGLSTVLNGKTIFDNVSLTIPRGRITAVMGRAAPARRR